MAGSSMTFGNQAPLTPSSVMRKTTVTWTSDDATGAVSGTSTETFRGLFWGITTDPSATAPTDNYDIVMTDDAGRELLGGTAGASSTDGNGMNRDTTNTEFAAASPYPMPIDGAVTIAITNAGNSKQGTIYIWTELR